VSPKGRIGKSSSGKLRGPCQPLAPRVAKPSCDDAVLQTSRHRDGCETRPTAGGWRSRFDCLLNHPDRSGYELVAELDAPRAGCSIGYPD
jgi:hypothetical protein